MENLVILIFLALIGLSYVYYFASKLVKKIMLVKNNLVIGDLQAVKAILLSPMTLVALLLVISYEMLF